MCGIFLVKRKNAIAATEKEKIINNFNKIQHRGPDESRDVWGSNVMLGFHSYG